MQLRGDSLVRQCRIDAWQGGRSLAQLPAVGSGSVWRRSTTSTTASSLRSSSSTRRRDSCIVCSASGVSKVTSSLKSVIQGGSDPVYVAAATYLKSIGFVNQAEVARVLDIATNPNSLFVQYNDAKRSRNASARELTVEDDMAPVVEYLKSRGLSTPEVVAVVAGHPPVLSYSVEERLAPFWDYMQDTVGLQDVGAVIAKRPSLLGLDLSNLEKIVGYLKSVDTPPETIVKYMMTSI